MPRRSRCHHPLALAPLSLAPLLALCWLLLLPLPAQAHAALVTSSPSEGDVLAAAPAAVALAFDEDVASPAFVSVIAPDGSNLAQGEADVVGATVTQAVRLVPQQGAYSIGYRVVSDDGHPVTGTIHFTVDPAHATGSPRSYESFGSPLRSATDTPFWQRESTWVVVALSTLAIGIGVVFALGLRSGTSSDRDGDG